MLTFLVRSLLLAEWKFQVLLPGPGGGSGGGPFMADAYSGGGETGRPWRSIQVYSWPPPAEAPGGSDEDGGGMVYGPPPEALRTVMVTMRHVLSIWKNNHRMFFHIYGE